MKKILIIGTLALLMGLSWWLIAPAFMTTVVDDTMPELSTKIPDLETPNRKQPISGTPGHPASGTVQLLHTTTGNGQRVIRYENYQGTNGPDLFVYLAKDLEANEFVSLGRARGNQGNINYEIPADVDLSEYTYVITWCRTFGVLFDCAKIN